jgi:hypothetical protein
MFTTLVTGMRSDKNLIRAVSQRLELYRCLRRVLKCLLLGHCGDKITDAMQSRMARKGSRQALSALTMPQRYYSVCHVSTGYRANHAECAYTPHGSNPTLVLAVSGLPRIIHPRKHPVLRVIAAPTTHCLLGPRFCQVRRTSRS